jgi:uncharacterized protein YndB with AHSA1/START domain
VSVVADTVLEVQRRLAGSPPDVFGFLTDQARYARWMGRSATLDPRPGGVYRVEMSDDVIAQGSYVELIPHSLIVFTWGWVGSPDIPPGSSRVTIQLEPDGDGTLLTLTHSGLPDDTAVAMHREGWDMYLDRLELLASGAEPPALDHP